MADNVVRYEPGDVAEILSSRTGLWIRCVVLTWQDHERMVRAAGDDCMTGPPQQGRTPVTASDGEYYYPLPSVIRRVYHQRLRIEGNELTLEDC
jgi:hypothetical protein